MSVNSCILLQRRTKKRVCLQVLPYVNKEGDANQHGEDDRKCMARIVWIVICYGLICDHGSDYCRVLRVGLNEVVKL